jgi:hypothetical protein
MPPRPQSALHFLKQDAGPAGLESVMRETEKLEHSDPLGLPPDLFVKAYINFEVSVWSDIQAFSSV